MRIAIALVLLIFSILASSVVGIGAARSEMLHPIVATPGR